MKTENIYPLVSAETARKHLDRAVEQHHLTRTEADLILEFVTDRQSTRADFGAARYTKYCSKLRTFREHYLETPWNEITFPDFVQAIGNLKNDNLKAETIKDYILICKLFYAWMIEERKIPDVPQFERKLSKIQLPKKEIIKLDTKTEILTKTEIQKLIAGGKTTEEKAMFGIWYELALRPNEVIGLKWSDVTPDDGGCYINVRTTKTRYPRNIWCSLYYNHLLAWQNTTPHNKPDDYIFCKPDGSHYLEYDLSYLTHRRMKETGCKDVPPYHIRHSRAMHLILEGVKETTLKMILEGHTDTDILKHYITPDEQTIRDELRSHYGLIEKTEMQKPVKHKVCPKCNYLNTPDSKYCRNCGTALDNVTKTKQDKMIENIYSIGQMPDDEGSKSISDLTVDELLELIKRKMGQ